MRDYKSMNVEIGLFMLPYFTGAFVIKAPISSGWNLICAVVGLVGMWVFCYGVEWVKARAVDRDNAARRGGEGGK